MMTSPDLRDSQGNPTFNAANELLEAAAATELTENNLNATPPSAKETAQYIMEKLGTPTTERPPYSIEDAFREQPLMHYTRAGNIFQILRFGLQSNNFKNRLNTVRAEDPRLEDIAHEMTGFRYQQGGSYQGKDSISMSRFSENMHMPPGNILVLVDPAIQTYGDEPGRREKTGYGHGIRTEITAEGFEVGNPTAYSDEVLAANLVPPSDIHAVIMDDRTSIMWEMSGSAREHAKLFAYTKQRDQEGAVEDLLANVRLIASLTEGSELQPEIDALGARATGMSHAELTKSVIQLQRRVLTAFAGVEPVTDDALRDRIAKTFGVDILSKPRTFTGPESN